MCAVQAPQWRSCVESGEDGLGDARLPDGGGAFLRSLSHPNHATGWFDPATPLPDAEVSFHRGKSSDGGHGRLGRIELPRVSCSSLPFTKCRVLPH